MIIYNLFPPLAGKMGLWEKHMARAAGMGFNWVFVNPIQYPGFSGSLYSIKDYFTINPLFLDKDSGKTQEEQVREVAGQAEKLGMKMMIDLVINHCAVDSDLLKKNPEWFLWEGPGKPAHPFCDENGKKVVWGDLAKFDHKSAKAKEGLFNLFMKILKFLIGLGFKGFRCDAAYQLPGSLWERLIRETKAGNPDILFFAETLGCSADQTRKTAKAGFDYIFNSCKWWDFHSPWLMENYNLTREIAPSVGFPESHDTQRLGEELNGNINGLKQRYLFSAMFSAGVMMPLGFEFGFRKRTHVVKSRPEDWEETGLDLTTFIRSANRVKEEHPVFQEDAPTQVLHHGNPNVLLLWKASVHTTEEALVILNKDIHNKQGFYAGNLYDFVQGREPLVDVSPEPTLDYIPTPFSYELQPGQGIVLVTRRKGIFE
ncbi:MAG: alpha-amylase [Nitrospinae bacterium]|nr:alpha-amylase [Nitrospinota bacterium]